MAQTFDIKNHKLINQVNGVSLAHYIETGATTKAEVAGANFFLDIQDQLAVGSVLICSVSDGVSIRAVTASNATTLTTASIAATS